MFLISVANKDQSGCGISHSRHLTSSFMYMTGPARSTAPFFFFFFFLFFFFCVLIFCFFFFFSFQYRNGREVGERGGGGYEGRGKTSGGTEECGAAKS